MAVSSPDEVCISTTTGSMPGALLGGLVHDEVGSLGHDDQIVVGDEGGDLHGRRAHRGPGRRPPRSIQTSISRGYRSGHETYSERTDTQAGCLDSETPSVPVRRLDPDLDLPSYARIGDAGADLCARHDSVLAPGGGRVLVATGIALALPTGTAGFYIEPRSGLALRHGVTCLNSPV